jgi:hypothetical protein
MAAAAAEQREPLAPEVEYCGCRFTATMPNEASWRKTERVFVEKFGAIYVNFIASREHAAKRELLVAVVAGERRELVTRFQSGDWFSEKFIDSWCELFPSDNRFYIIVPSFLGIDELTTALLRVRRAMSDENAQLREQVYLIEKEKIKLRRKLATAENDVEELKLEMHRQQSAIVVKAKIDDMRVRAELAEKQIANVEQLKAENELYHHRNIELERQNTELRQRNLSLNATVSMHQSKLGDYSRTVHSSQLSSPSATT